MNKLLLPLAAALALSSVATAGPRAKINSVVVNYADLNLNSTAGVASLHKRIRNAAESVCSDLETRILGLRDAYDACVTDAVEHGVTAVGNDNLTNFHSRGSNTRLASNRS